MPELTDRDLQLRQEASLWAAIRRALATHARLTDRPLLIEERRTGQRVARGGSIVALEQPDLFRDYASAARKAVDLPDGYSHARPFPPPAEVLSEISG